jgi:hypothetical protein
MPRACAAAEPSSDLRQVPPKKVRLGVRVVSGRLGNVQLGEHVLAGHLVVV